MAIQGDSLVMVAVGVHDEVPRNALQPKLPNGIHLRWAAPRDKGLPWYGYYLFRRPHEFRGQRCVAGDLEKLAVGPLGHREVNVELGAISSDTDLVVCDDFPGNGAELELDLRGRAWLRCDLALGEPAFRVDAAIGFREDATPRRICIGLDALDLPALKNPFTIDGVRFQLAGGQRPRPVRRPIVLGDRAALGLSLTDRLDITLPVAVATVEVDASVIEGAARLELLDQAGRVVASAAIPRGKPARLPKPVRLSFAGKVERCRLTVTAPAILVLHQLCYLAPQPPAAITLTALDGETVVASRALHGRAGEVIAATLVADRITAVTITGGPGALVSLCVRPISMGLGADWAAVPQCPEPITLPIVHPDYPAVRGPEDLVASRQRALDRVVYGPPAAWAAEFPSLHDQLRALVVHGPPGPPANEMADPSRAQQNVAGTPTVPAPGVPDPHVMSLHPLDLVLTGALHPPIAQMVGLYWADQTAQPAAVYDYLIVADIGNQGRGDPKLLLEAVRKSWKQADGWICFARQAQSGPPVPAPSELRGYSLPGASFRAPGPAGAPVDDCAGNVGLTWHLDRDERGFLQPGAAIFHHVWRDAQGNLAAPTPSAEANDLATSSGPLLMTRPTGISTQAPSYPGDWPQFSMQFLDFALAEGWYGYQLTAIDLFGRFSSKSAFAQWRQWAPPPAPRPWYYIDPPADRQVHPSSIRVRDVGSPPQPAAVEAWALDPKDPMLIRDAAYAAWLATLPPANRDSLIGLRVRWRWTVAQQRQAPDTAEFRVYWQPSTNPPAQWQDIARWPLRCAVCTYAQHVTVAADGSRTYEVFLPVVGIADPFAAGVPLVPTRQDPVAYGQVTVSAVDDDADIADRWPGAGPWAGRTGNESGAASPARVFRVHRTPPDAPRAIVDGPRAYATPADWNGHSYYSFRWPPEIGVQTHIHRAMDEAVFAADWAKRPRSPLDQNDPSRFPDPAAEPTWTVAKRAAVIATLSAFDTLATQGGTRDAAFKAYRALGDDELRVLANLPGVEKAFTQLTVKALDPADPATADQRGPDDPAGYVARPGVRRFLDQLDGRSTNRYLYRASYVDPAQNRSKLGPVGTPVRLPDTVPPRAPAVPSATAGNCRITLAWPSNREVDLLEYRVFRADTADAARDLRSMTQVAVIAADPDPALRPAAVTWIDEPMRGLVDRWYRIVAVDRADPIDPRRLGGNVSEPCSPVKARAFDTAPPTPPAPAVSWAAAAGTQVATATWTSPDESRLQGRELPSGTWTDIGGWRAAGTHVVGWTASDPTFGYELRVWARKYTGAIAVGAATHLDPV